MVFSDLKFWYFFAIVFAFVVTISLTRRPISTRNFVLLVSSYYFYAQWDWRFLSLILISTIVDFVAGRQIYVDERNRRYWLLTSLVVNLGILGFFKYFDFFIAEAAIALQGVGISASVPTLNIILPVGISFYTFQTLTYTIDIYRRQIKPCDSILTFATYVAFFPQLVAGPIERAASLLPQFDKAWVFDERKIIEGLRLILFGLVLKVVVADNLAPMVDDIFANREAFNGGELALGAFYFAFQIYGDFCGYSTIAIGISKLLNIELMTNFRTPYLATSIQDFWRRWHISLSSYFRDYVYIPLGGSRTTPGKRDRNLLVTFTLSGLWHGANWTFIVWGAYHGVLLIIQNRAKALLSRFALIPAPVAAVVGAGTTFLLVCIGWVLFRAENMTEAMFYLHDAVVTFDIPESKRSGVLYVMLALVLDFLWRKDTRLENVPLLDFGERTALTARWACYVCMFWLIVVSMANRSGIEQFIYFQF